MINTTQGWHQVSLRWWTRDQIGVIWHTVNHGDNAQAGESPEVWRHRVRAEAEELATGQGWPGYPKQISRWSPRYWLLMLLGMDEWRSQWPTKM